MASPGSGGVGGTRRDDIQEANSIFEQPWWLDAVAPGQWGEARVKRGPETAARMPYVLRKKLGLSLITMPPLTLALGPWLRASSAKYTNLLGEQKELMQELIEQLPKVDLHYQHLAPGLENWLPFHWQGFKQTTRYTYRIDNLTDLDAIWDDFRENIRREIRKAMKLVVVRDDLGLDCFVEMNELTFRRQGMKLPYDPKLVERLDEACAQRNRRKILFAEDASGRVYAAVYLIWDQQAAYYILGGVDPELRTSGAGSLVIWEAIKFASNITQSFDFKGSMIESIERFNRSFGAKQVPYHQVIKMSRRMRAINAGADIVGTVLRRQLSPHYWSLALLYPSIQEFVCT